MIDFARDLFGFIIHRKKFWMVPILIAMAILGFLLILSHGTTVAPFIYTIF